MHLPENLCLQIKNIVVTLSPVFILKNEDGYNIDCRR